MPLKIFSYNMNNQFRSLTQSKYLIISRKYINISLLLLMALSNIFVLIFFQAPSRFFALLCYRWWIVGLARELSLLTCCSVTVCWLVEFVRVAFNDEAEMHQAIRTENKKSLCYNNMYSVSSKEIFNLKAEPQWFHHQPKCFDSGTFPQSLKFDVLKYLMSIIFVYL